MSAVSVCRAINIPRKKGQMSELKTNLIILGIAVVVSLVVTFLHTSAVGLGSNGTFTEIREWRILYASGPTSVEAVSCDVFSLYSPTGRALHGERLESNLPPEYPNCKTYYVRKVDEFDSGYWRLQASGMVYVREVSADSLSEGQLSFYFANEQFWSLVVRSSLLWFFVLTLCWSGLAFWADLERLLKKTE